MKKKLLSALLCVAMVASLVVGCGGKEEAAEAPAPEATEEVAEEATEEVAEEATEETAEEVAEEATEEVVEEVAEEAVRRGIMGFKMICDNYYVSDPDSMALVRKIAENHKLLVCVGVRVFDGNKRLCARKVHFIRIASFCIRQNVHFGFGHFSVAVKQ